MTQPRGRKAHHPDCDKEWWTAFNQLVPADSCPTCRSLLDDNSIFDAEMLEVMYASWGWSCERVDPDNYPTDTT